MTAIVFYFQMQQEEANNPASVKRWFQQFEYPARAMGVDKMIAIGSGNTFNYNPTDIEFEMYPDLPSVIDKYYDVYWVIIEKTPVAHNLFTVEIDTSQELFFVTGSDFGSLNTDDFPYDMSKAVYIPTVTQIPFYASSAMATVLAVMKHDSNY